jgi:peptidoglycan/xylan/chitin deacetylase (PgdA/CDA1 family)
MNASPAPVVDGILAEHQPASGSAPGWPLVLYFHHVHPDLRHYTALTPGEFERGLERVLTAFDPYPPGDLLAPGGPRRPDSPTVLVTFDDGYADNVVHALPVLDRLGVHAVFFVCTGLLGQRSDNPRADHLTRTDCDRLAGAGHLVAAHTRTHPHLDRLPTADAQQEIDESIGDITGWYGPDPAKLFAYPYGGVPRAAWPPADALAFGTVRSPAVPWSEDPHRIRRTYLPAGAPDSWGALVRHWRDTWGTADTPTPTGRLRNDSRTNGSGRHV